MCIFKTVAQCTRRERVVWGVGAATMSLATCFTPAWQHHYDNVFHCEWKVLRSLFTVLWAGSERADYTWLMRRETVRQYSCGLAIEVFDCISFVNKPDKDGPRSQLLSPCRQNDMLPGCCAVNSFKLKFKCAKCYFLLLVWNSDLLFDGCLLITLSFSYGGPLFLALCQDDARDCT